MGLASSSSADLATGSPQQEWRSRVPASSRFQQAGPEASIFETYEIDGLLGSGLFGQVRACWPLSEPKRRCAVKIVDTRGEVFQQASRHLSARMEVSILQAVDHPHIVKLLDVFDQDRWLFLVLECVGGGELFSAFADPRTVVTEGCVSCVGGQVLQALRHLHERSIVHRDVKAENILLTSSPSKTSRWHVKLIDFGLAMRTEQPRTCFLGMTCRDQGTLEELICGTAYYCAPEVWFNDYTPKVDIWAVGVVLYLALHGAFPYYHQDPERLEAIICDAAIAPAYMPTKAKDSGGYQVSRDARRCLEALLAQEQEHRPSAERALQLSWIRGGSGGNVDGDLQSAAIPLSVRTKAARAAERPPVDMRLERGRTVAFEAMKARFQYARAVQRSSKIGGGDDFKSGDSSTTRDSDVEQLPVLTWDQDVAPADTSLSDSEVEEDAPMCACGRVRPPLSDIQA